MLRAVNMGLFFMSSKLVLFLCFVTFALLGNTLTSECVFVSMALFNSLRLAMTLYFPFGVGQGAETLVSIRRLQVGPPVHQATAAAFSPCCIFWMNQHAITALRVHPTRDLFGLFFVPSRVISYGFTTPLLIFGKPRSAMLMNRSAAFPICWRADMVSHWSHFLFSETHKRG